MSRKKSGKTLNRKDHQHKLLTEGLINNGMAREDKNRRKKWTLHDLAAIKPLSTTQENMFHTWENYEHLCAYGSAGTGKTFLSMYLALTDLLNPTTKSSQLIIVRSIVATRDIGFLPGTLEEKIAVYETAYVDICEELLGRATAYEDLKKSGHIKFIPTSFIRGVTWDNAIIIVDEIQNMEWPELDSVVTRVGHNSRIILCGDESYQNDLGTKTGINKALKTINGVESIGVIKFDIDDIVRSKFIKDWIVAKKELEF